MDVCIAVDGEERNGEELGEWLRREPELRGLVRVVARPPRPEAMGVPLVFVVSVLGSGTLTAVARSVRTWLERRRPDVRIDVETDRGRVSLSVTDAKDPEALLRRLAEITADAPPAD